MAKRKKSPVNTKVILFIVIIIGAIFAIGAAYYAGQQSTENRSHASEITVTSCPNGLKANGSACGGSGLCCQSGYCNNNKCARRPTSCKANGQSCGGSGVSCCSGYCNSSNTCAQRPTPKPAN